ncbi:hypothetical protein [Flavisericum labens]|uniref:hypothetical protein n=1 Tax=Flavisericum labens TaxID=3377112 RepID=UPI00387A8CFF
MKTLLFFALLPLSLVTFGQNKDYSVVKTRKFIEPFVKTELVASVEDQKGGIYTIRYYDEYVSMKHHHSNSVGFIVQHWDSLQQSQSYNNYKIETDKKGIIAGFTIAEEKLHVLEYEKNKRDKTIDCFLHKPIDYTNELKREKIFSIDIKRFPNFIIPELSNNLDSNYYGNMEFSENGKYIAFHIDSYSKDTEAHKIFVFNGDFKMVWEKEFTHNEKDRLFDIHQVKVDNHGDVYILGKVYHNKRQNVVKKKVNYHYEVFKVTENKTEHTYLNLLDRFAHTMSLVIKDNQVNCIGIYSEKSDLNVIEFFAGKDQFAISGTLFFSINKDNMKIINTLFQKFSPEFLTNKYDVNGDKENGGYIIKKIKTLKDGGCLLIAEEFHVQTKSYSYFTPNGFSVNSINVGSVSQESKSYVTLNYNDIVVLRLDKLGNLVWSKNINKHHIGSSFSDKLVSCSTLVHNEDSYIFLNERKNVMPVDNNLNFQINKFGNINKKNSNLYMVKLDGSGNISCDALHLNRYNDIMFYPVNGQSVYNSQMVIFGSNEKQKQFLTFKLN